MPTVIYSPADLPDGAVIAPPERPGEGARSRALLKRVRPDLVFDNADAGGSDAGYALLTSADWRPDLARCRDVGLADDRILVMPELDLNWPLAEWSYSYWAVPLDFIEHEADGGVRMSFGKLHGVLVETGLITAELDGHHVCDGYKAGHPADAAAYTEVLAMLGDDASRVDYLTILFGEPHQVWESWCHNLYNQLEYMDYATISPGDVIVNCGVMGGCELPLFLAALDGRGAIVNIDPLGYDHTLPYVREALARNTELHHEVRAAAHSEDATLRLPLWHGMAMGGRANQGMDGFPERDFPARAIDGVVGELGLDRVDYIKMDIEGAEIAALEGASETIGRFRPQLAISIYHERDHYWRIPLMLRAMCPDYRFFVKHYHYTCAETLLYAIPAERPVRARRDRIACALG